MEYSAGLTSKLFWLQESRKTAAYILEGLSKADIRKIAWEENILSGESRISRLRGVEWNIPKGIYLTRRSITGIYHW